MMGEQGVRRRARATHNQKKQSRENDRPTARHGAVMSDVGKCLDSQNDRNVDGQVPLKR